MDIVCPYGGTPIPLLKYQGILGVIVRTQYHSTQGRFYDLFFVWGKLGVENLYDRD